LSTSLRSLASLSSTDTAVAAAMVGASEASKGKDGRRCQTSGGVRARVVCVVCARGSRSGEERGGFLYSAPRIPSAP
jgi:hypothetical protein